MIGAIRDEVIEDCEVVNNGLVEEIYIDETLAVNCENVEAASLPAWLACPW